jgi:hypothetical protein
VVKKFQTQFFNIIGALKVTLAKKFSKKNRISLSKITVYRLSPYKTNNNDSFETFIYIKKINIDKIVKEVERSDVSVSM